MHLRYYLLPATSTQSILIANILKKYVSNVVITGVVPNFSYKISRSIVNIYDNIVQLDEINNVQNNQEISENIIVPTGAVMTKYVLEKFGTINVGKVKMTKDVLKCYDKGYMVNLAETLGIAVPKTWYTVDEISSFPVFFKQKFERGGGIRGIAKDKKELRRKIKDSEEKLLFQEFIDSQGTYGVSFIAQDGEIIVSHIHHEILSVPKQGGSAVVIENFYDQRLLEYTKKLLASLKYNGWGLAEFKYSPKIDDYVFMEVNAKFWESCRFSFEQNPMFLKLLFSIDGLAKPNYQRMIFFERFLHRGWSVLSLPVYTFGKSTKVVSDITIDNITLGKALAILLREVSKTPYRSLKVFINRFSVLNKKR